MTTANRTAPAKRTTEFTLPSDREVKAVRVFDAPRDLIWEAHTNPKHVSQWMLGPDGWTMPVCEMDVRPGGEWHWEWAKPGEESFGMRGVYREVVRPERLVNTESWGEDWPESLNTTVFTEENGRTTVTSTVLWGSKEARDKALSTGMNEGWGKSYDRLDEYLPVLSGAK